ncbi:hypothetical protein N658DRAFT_550362 [Parathielavia hyrcaniae]|uniref:Uncharacterized protein n=1 Tax=Parathielavia hyrcaniae TaxID=113614 RepID=A0AAN6SXM4_9PEZI|nr:hypothetical protein N658DRAFT_550362 [Parathielavia hyrcaniae]
MKASTTILLTSVLSFGFASASACTRATAEEVTPYLIDWGVMDKDSASTGGGSGICAGVLEASGVDAFNECINDWADIDVNFARRLAKMKRSLWLLAGRQSTLECTGNEICGAFSAMTDEMFCMDPGSGEWHSADGSTGNWRTGHFDLADGTSGNHCGKNLYFRDFECFLLIDAAAVRLARSAAMKAEYMYSGR